jgi:hypothetical protein
MTVFMVERDLPGITTEQLAGAQKAAIEKGQEMTDNGQEVRYIRSIYVPGEAKCMCLFEAPDADLVKRLNDDAGIPYTEVKEALDLTPKAQPE